jgi:uncharacterized membrane protein
MLSHSLTTPAAHHGLILFAMLLILLLLMIEGGTGFLTGLALGPS